MPGPGLDLIGEEEIAEVLSVLRSRHLVRYGPEDDPAFGAKVRRLEERVARLTGVEHAVAVNSGSSALLVALAGLAVGAGDEVIVPGFTYVATMSAVVYAGALPVLAEIDETLNLDPADVEARITPRTRAVVAVDMLGSPARLDELRAVTARHGVALIEDCAQAFGASYRGRAVGSLGTVGILSFNVFKTITCGDGGMLVTADPELYQRCFAMHDQGHSPHRLGIEIGQRPFLGLNFRMTELNAAVLLAQLAKLDRIREHLRAQKGLFKSLVADLPGLRFRTLPDPEGDLATHLVVLFPTAAMARQVANRLGSRVLADSGWHIYSQMEHLLNRRTATMKGCPFYCGCHPDRGAGYRAGMLPRTDDLVARAMTLGIGVADPNLGSSFGVTMRDGPEAVHQRAARFRHRDVGAPNGYLHNSGSQYGGRNRGGPAHQRRGVLRRPSFRTRQCARDRHA
jgi:dTDP-4-amino-4,6-dideoxygalactose transaminase